EFKVIKDTTDILSEALGIKVDPSQHVLLQLTEAVNKFNENSSGTEKLIEHAEKKFNNKVLGHIAEKIGINQAGLLTILGNFEVTYSFVTTLFCKLCNIVEFTKEVKEKMSKVDKDMQSTFQELQLEPSSSSAH
ncbi:hypothetical protein, partial [[Clostridium] innocuum]|uniref:hypothetical protein n=1 Tax=Clostridium innocuum TaxID=1522 RepID=UPI0005D2B91B